MVRQKDVDMWLAALRLLLMEEDADAVWWSNADWEGMSRLAVKNVVVVRMERRLRELGVSVGGALSQAAHDETLRVSDTIELINRLTNCCVRERVPFVFPKAFQHYPDMGHDVDLLIGERSTRLDRVLKKELSAQNGATSLLNRASGKIPYEIPGYSSPLELHHGLAGQIGEHETYVRELIDRGVHQSCHNGAIRVPSQEDQVIIQAIQRVYGHFSLRVSDVVATVRALRTPQLDWTAVSTTSERIGVSTGVTSYLASIRQVLELAGSNHFPWPTAAIELSMCSKSKSKLSFRDDTFHLSLIGTSIPAFAAKWIHDCRSGQWASAMRLGLLPGFAALGTVRWASRRITNQFGGGSGIE